MKRILLALALLLLPSIAFAQCNGIVPNNYACGNVSGGPNVLQPIPLSSFPANTPGGTSGQLQTNNGAGGFAGVPNTLGQVLNAQAGKTANYPIVSTDCNTTVVMGTGTTAQLTLTLPSLPSTGFAPGCTIAAINDDVYAGTGTGHAMTLAGFPAAVHTKLYPQNAVIVVVNSAGTGWKVLLNPGRWLLPTSAEICYTQNGSNANDGLGAGTGCMASVQQALAEIGNFWDGGGYNVCAIGIYAGGTSQVTESVSQTGQSGYCYLTIRVRGNFTWTTAGACYTGGDNSITIFDWSFGFVPTFSCNTGNALSTGQLKCHQYCVFDISLSGGTAIWLPGGVPGVNTGTNDSFFDCDLQCSATMNAQINVGDGTHTFTPRAIVECEAHCSKVTASGVIASSANVTFSQMFILHSGSVITTNLTYPGTAASQPSVPTGLSNLITNGTTIPGGTTPAAPGSGCAQNAATLGFGIVCLTAL